MREWEEKNATEAKVIIHIRYFISSLAEQSPKRMGALVRGHWSIENRNHHKRDDSVWQEDRHRHRRINVAQNLALTRNALLAVIPFTDKQRLPALIADYLNSPSLAIKLILHASPVP